MIKYMISNILSNSNFLYFLVKTPCVLLYMPCIHSHIILFQLLYHEHLFSIDIKYSSET